MSAARTRVCLLLGVAAFGSGLLRAHVGSPDVFFQGKAGPYPVLVSIRPPEVIPGIARIEVRGLSPEIQRVELAPTPMTGEAAKHPPVPDVAQRSASDPQYYEGQLWLMGFGSWEVHVHVFGPSGSGELLVPVPAIATKASSMQPAMGWFLFGMMVFLSVGMVAIAGASAREARLEPGAPAPAWNARSLATMAVAALVVGGGLWFGKAWWADDAATYARRLYKPLGAEARLEDGGNSLEIRLTDPGWMAMRKLDDLVTDHGHLMHLFLVSSPAQDTLIHLHPDQTATGYFSAKLPAMAAGTYRVYADIVHDNGLAETAVGEVKLPVVRGGAPDDGAQGDDSAGVFSPDSRLPDGYRMVWKHDAAAPPRAKQVGLLTFEMQTPDGQPVTDLEPYMGMGGHAEILKRDGTVFAHIHPTGSVPMASLDVASMIRPQSDDMAGMHHMDLGPEVSFPYGFPKAGEYRVYVQMKRAGKVETGAFDLTVVP